MTLSEIIRGVLAEEASDELDDLVKAVSAQIPDSDLRTRLEEALRGLVSDRMRLDVHVVTRAAQREGRSTPTPTPTKWGGSTLYLKFLQQRLTVSGRPKRVSELDHADLLSLYDERLKAAKATAKEAKRYQMFAGALKQNEVKVLGELPEAIVLEILRWEP